MNRADLVVVGAGVAGLTAALRAARAGLKVIVLNKGSGAEAGDVERSTATFYAQGGIAVVLPDNPEDSVALHVADTMTAGAGLVAVVLWLAAGGAAYLVGTAFFVFDSSLRFGHFVWHLFVMAGSGCRRRCDRSPGAAQPRTGHGRGDRSK